MASDQGVLNSSSWVATKDPRIKLRHGVYWARFSVRGIAIAKSLKTDRFALALQQVEKIHANILLGKDPQDDGKKLIFEQAWARFLKDKENGVCTQKGRPRTLKEYSEFGQRYFMDFWSHRRIDKVTTDDWSDYVAHIKKERGDIKMFNHHKYMQGFFSWAYEKELVRKKPKFFNPDPVEGDDEDGVGKNFSDAELKKIEQHLKPGPFMTYVLMGMYMGMRSSEITQLKKDRIDLGGKFIRLKKSDTKTKKARSVAIHDRVFPHIESQYKSNNSLVLFPNRDDIDRPMDRSGFKRQWDNMRQELGIEGRPHDLRHSLATRLFADPHRNPVLVCKFLGMSMRTAESTYIHFSEKHLLSVVEGFML